MIPRAERTIHSRFNGRFDAFLHPAEFTKDTPDTTAGFKHRLTSGYEVQMEFPYVAGRMFMRTIEGRVVCYDLGKNAGR